LHILERDLRVLSNQESGILRKYHNTVAILTGNWVLWTYACKQFRELSKEMGKQRLF